MTEKECKYLTLLMESEEILYDLLMYGSFYSNAIEMEQYPENGKWRESDGRVFEDRIIKFLFKVKDFKNEDKEESMQ